MELEHALRAAVAAARDAGRAWGGGRGPDCGDFLVAEDAVGEGGRCPEGADRVGFGVEQWRAAEFVAEDLQRVLRQAVGESVEGLVERRFEGVGVVVRVVVAAV